MTAIFTNSLLLTNRVKSIFSYVHLDTFTVSTHLPLLASFVFSLFFFVFLMVFGSHPALLTSKLCSLPYNMYQLHTNISLNSLHLICGCSCVFFFVAFQNCTANMSHNCSVKVETQAYRNPCPDFIAIPRKSTEWMLQVDKLPPPGLSFSLRSRKRLKMNGFGGWQLFVLIVFFEVSFSEL